MLTSRQILGALGALTASLALFYPVGQNPHASGADGETACPLGYGRKGDADARLQHPHAPGDAELSAFPLARVFANATIWTGDAAVPFAEAMAVTDAGRVLAVGSKNAVLAAAGAGAPVVSLRGRHVIPGIQDAHLHLVSGGFRLNQLDLSKCTGRADFIAQTRAAAERLDADGDDGAWLLGGGWDESRWDQPSVPDSSWLKEALAATKHPERPVWLLRADARAGLASESALAAANAEASVSDPPGGSIGRFAGSKNTPDGLIRENAVGVITAVVPAPSDAQRVAAYHRAFARLLSLGITSVSDFGDIDSFAGSFEKGASERVWLDFEILEALDAGDELPLRVSAYAPLSDWERARDHAKRGYFKERRDDALSKFRVAGCTAFLDGLLVARTARFREPYSDDPENRGEPSRAVGEYESLVIAADAVGLQIATHVVGDVAVAAAANAAERAVASNGVFSSNDGGSARFRVERPRRVPLPSESSVTELRLVADRSRNGGEASRARVARNVPLAFGSDWPVAEANPFEAMRAAVDRREPGSSEAPQPRDPGQTLSPSQALAAYTTGAARVSGTAGLLGTLWRGAMADFVVLDSDPLDGTSGNDVPKVLATYVDGECVYGDAPECVKE